MAVRRLSVAIAILWVDTAVALIDSSLERVGALADVFQVSAHGEAVKPFEAAKRRVVVSKNWICLKT
jgi:hypothetical protein